MPRASLWKLLVLPGLFAIILGSHLASAADSKELIPVPKALEQGKAERAIRDKYKKELMSRDPDDQLALARRMRQSAETAEDSPSKFVLLREARDLAIHGGDFCFSMAIIDDIAKTFSIDTREMKISALMIGVDTAGLAGDAVAQNYMKVSDEFYNNWDLDLAKKANYLAWKLTSNNAGLRAEVKDRDKKIAARNRVIMDALAAEKKLAKTPDDPQANFVVGRHLCFNANRWDNGLPYLVKGPTGPLHDLAAQDIANPSEVAKMAALADGWWNFSDAKANIPAGAGRKRAAFWYAKALPSLTGEKKAEAEKRIAETQTPTETKAEK